MTDVPNKREKKDSLILRQKNIFILSYSINDSTSSPGGFGSIFAGYVPLSSQSPFSIIAPALANYRLHLGHFWANVIFAIRTLIVTLYLCMYLSLKEHFTFHYSTNILALLLTVNMKNCLTPKISANERPHSSNSIEITTA